MDRRLLRSSLPLLLACLAANQGCGRRDAGNHHEGVQLAQQAPAPRLLRGELLTATAPLLSAPTDIEVVGTFLVVLDAYADSVLLVLDRETGALRARGGPRGRGPGEILEPGSIDPLRDGSGFWVYDFGLRRLTLYQIPNLDRLRVINFFTEVTVYDPAWLDSHVAALGFFPDRHRVWVFDSLGKRVGGFGSLPASSVPAPVHVLQHAYQAALVTNPARTRLAVLTRHSGRVTIFERDGSLVTDTSGPVSFEPVFGVGEGARGPVMVSDERLRFGYIDGTATESRLFALFSGRRRADFPGEANFGEYVHVFDWNGTLREVLRLDTAALAIAVDPDGRTLYAARHSPEPAIVRYSLVNPD
ncbi:MAG: hypothetical protein KatS3mg081_2169 [Gemmatimonadales bacterium]|nr:MAG: hypothetical protein KatS3mg081_2169 [Gemmatimonadales bacterium]